MKHLARDGVNVLATTPAAARETIVEALAGLLLDALDAEERATADEARRAPDMLVLQERAR